MTHKKVESRYEPIEDYGIIGNLQTVALVSRNASLDFMCFPAFDSPTVFCKLLDADKGGSFSIAAEMKNIMTKQLYLPNTNVLVTRFLAQEGIAEIIDFMPVNEDKNNTGGMVIRMISTVRGCVKYAVKCSPRFNYAKDKHSVKKEAEAMVFTPESADQKPLRLISDRELEIEGDDAKANFTLNEQETACFILMENGAVNSKVESVKDFAKQRYDETINYWKNWISKSNYKGQWQEVVSDPPLP